MRCLITAGPTREHLDPVRFLSNGSSGKMGYALAAAALRRGWQVDLVTGPVCLTPPDGASVTSVISADEMYRACRPLFPQCDLFLAVAAVADYRPKQRFAQKIKKTGTPEPLELEPTIDILKTLAVDKRPGQTVVGFAAETNDLEAYARRKLHEKRLDWIIGNDISRSDVGIGAEANAIVMISCGGERYEFGPAAKRDVADYVLTRLNATSVH